MSAAGMPLDITLFTKRGGVLSKRIALNPDGSIRSDGSACVMTHGTARRVTLDGPADLARLLESMGAEEAIGLGALRVDLADEVEVVVKRKLNGARPDLIARTGEYIVYEPGAAGFALLDHDRKGMPDHVAAEIDRHSGFYKAIAAVLPSIATAARLGRRSTSAGLYHSGSGQKLAGSDGVHVYVAVRDAADIPRFLTTLHDRCWVAGMGWMMVGAAGQLLNRSIIDRMVAAPERLVFEGPPVLEPPLAQDGASRRPHIVEGGLLDTLTECPPLTVRERDQLRRLVAKETQRLAGECAVAREAFIDRQAALLVDRTGITPAAARHVVERQCEGVLLSSLELPFDDLELRGCTVADVLADPGRFVGETLADPLEGVDYGAGKAKIMRRADGSLWIHSFAHGRTVYELKLDAAAIKAMVAAAREEEAVALFVRLAVDHDLDQHAITAMATELAKRCGTGVRAIAKDLQARRQKRARERAEAERQRRLAERSDARPRIEAPPSDAPFLPVMKLLNEVLGSADEPEPPMRNVDGAFTRVRVRRLPEMHALTAASANAEGNEDPLPAPEQPLLTSLNEEQMAEEIERHVDFYNPGTEASVHLGGLFVRHFMVRNDDALPQVAAIATAPLVLPGRRLLAPLGLLREHGIVFRIPPAVRGCLPRPNECDTNAARAALNYLTDEWLVDVSTDFAGKCALVALALTIIQRSLLSSRPAFWVTAAQRGGGKSTSLCMVLLAATGIWPAAAAWSPSDEERRKALFAYLLSGVPCLVWDNIPRGATISCPHIERSCTTGWYSDRKLGVSETVATSAATIHCFTGNNCGPRGDLASRSITTRIEVNRVDPENREFRHPDPIGWTEANRGRLLNAFYTILLANSGDAEANGKVKTRFKGWWQLIGAPIEQAAKASGRDLDFGRLFIEQEADEPDAVNLGEALAAMQTQWPDTFTALDVCRLLTNIDAFMPTNERERSVLLRDFLFRDAAQNVAITAAIIGMRLRRSLGAPAIVNNQTLQLAGEKDLASGIVIYRVRAV
jgi:hypothetical protein